MFMFAFISRRRRSAARGIVCGVGKDGSCRDAAASAGHLNPPAFVL
jgi:hypothetical protein